MVSTEHFDNILSFNEFTKRFYERGNVRNTGMVREESSYLKLVVTTPFNA